jgi:steroid delta-isomerase-like uncharacterized protein
LEAVLARRRLLMSDDAIQVAREDVEAFNDGDWERFRASLTDDSVYEEFATQRRVDGADEIIAANQAWKEAFPDARGTIENAVASGGTVTLEITWRGTQSGPLATEQGEIPASNRQVEVHAVQVMEVSDGKVRRNRHYFDMLSMLQQIGAVEQPA